jgi:large subunit ribosomal protein L16
MLEPKRSKYRKQFRGKMRGKSLRASKLAFGDYGLKSLECGWVAGRQIEAARVAITRHTKRAGKIWTRIFPDKPITARAAGVRMGGGKGDIKGHVAVVRPGRIILELAGVPSGIGLPAMKRAAAKLPLKTKIIVKEERNYEKKASKGS